MINVQGMILSEDKQMNSHSSCPVLFSVATKTLNGHIRSSVKQRNKVISLQISNFLLNMRSVEDNQFKFFCLLIKHICNSNMVNSLKNGECFKMLSTVLTFQSHSYVLLEDN